MVAELADLRDTLLAMAREKLSTRQVLMLSTSAPVEESLLVDPSIRQYIHTISRVSCLNNKLNFQILRS